MKVRTLVAAVTTVAAATVLLGTTTIASATPAPKAYTCGGGARPGFNPAAWTFVSIPSGTYSSLTVTGVCQVAPGAVIHAGNVNLAAGSVLDAQTFASRITVEHNVTAEPGSLLGLGCLPNPPDHTTGHPCVEAATGNPSNARSSITINGNVTAKGADTVLLNGIFVRGNVTLNGGGEQYIPWPIKWNTIGGNLVVNGVAANWVGVLLNNVGGSAILTNITVTDPTDPTPTAFVVSNTIGENLICEGIGPNLIAGFPGEWNVVGHQTIGQCTRD
jgi:hypothetical protein